MPSTPSTTTTTSRVLVATRIHGQETTAATPFDGAKLRAFLRSAVGYADAVAVAVEVADVFHPNLLVAVQDGSTQEFTITGREWSNFKLQWIERVDRYHSTHQP